MNEESAANRRLDKWLWHARFYKTRGAATTAVGGGKVRVNGERAKPSRRVAVGDRIELALDGVVADFEVLGFPERRGPAVEARAHYRETETSAARRAALGEGRRLAAAARPRPDSRPDKRGRRLLRRLHRGQS
ncbi:MAG TPA: RNA-binding S4 domain-containing protein [Steroidobacteraceae bacterium]|nr:RNA-binding S4 domain-containing protein [Steroidobacteraceae bacterium]